MKEIVEEHKQSYDENNMRDFIDVYLKEMKEGEAPEFTGINTKLLEIRRKVKKVEKLVLICIFSYAIKIYFSQSLGFDAIFLNK